METLAHSWGQSNFSPVEKPLLPPVLLQAESHSDPIILRAYFGGRFGAVSSARSLSRASTSEGFTM